MIRKKHITIKGNLFLEKGLWTLGVIACYVFGRNLPLVTLPWETTPVVGSDFIGNLAAITGGNFFQITPFSLGLGPWMTSIILWRFMASFAPFKQLTQRQNHYWQSVLMLLIAIIQAMGMISHLPTSQQPSMLFARVVTIVTLVSGSYVLSFLAYLNSLKGLGGTIIIVLVNLFLTSLQGLGDYLSTVTALDMMFWIKLLLLVISISLLILFSIIIYRAELRIKIRRLTIISEFAEATYIPIRLTPAGAMPYMYGMTLMILPPLLFRGLLSLFPHNNFFAYLLDNLSLSQLPGLLIYMSLLFLLAFGFAYYNYNPFEMAKAMRISGDYIQQIKPGQATETYLRQQLHQMTLIGACITSLIGGLPLLLVLGNPEQVRFSLLLNNIYIMTTMMLSVIEQVQVLRSWKQYKDII